MTIISETLIGPDGSGDWDPDSYVEFWDEDGRDSGGKLLTNRRQRVPITTGGVFTAILEPGRYMVRIRSGNATREQMGPYPILVPDSGTMRLWPLIASAVGLPADITYERLQAAVAAYVAANPGQGGGLTVEQIAAAAGNPATALGAELANTYAAIGDAAKFAPKPNTVGVLGDSITDFGSNANAIYEGKNLRGYWVWALARLGQRLKFVRDGGVASDTTAQMLARLDVYIGSQAPAWNWILGGTNDAAGLVALATTTGNLTAIVDRLEAAGGRCVLLTVPPRTGASTAVNTRINEINNWIRRLGYSRPNVIVADIFPKLAADTNYGFRSGASQDNVHPLPHGAALMGEVVAGAVESFIPKLSPLPAAVSDGINLVTNALLAGTAGTPNVGGTGQVADGWIVSAVDGVASVFACSKVARTDDIAGTWQQVKVTSGQVKAHWHVPYAAGAGYAFGDRLYAVCEFETDDDFVQGDGTLTNYFRLRLAATKPDFADGFAVADFDTANDTIQAPSSLMLRKGVLVTPVLTVPSTATLRLGFELQRKGAGTFRFSRAAIYREGTGPMY